MFLISACNHNRFLGPIFLFSSSSSFFHLISVPPTKLSKHLIPVLPCSRSSRSLFSVVTERERKERERALFIVSFRERLALRLRRLFSVDVSEMRCRERASSKGRGYVNESGERVQNAIAVKVLLPWSTVTGICICPSSSPLMHLSSLVNVKWSKLQRREKRKKSLPSFFSQSVRACHREKKTIMSMGCISRSVIRRSR